MFSLTNSAVAISALDSPRATWRSTSVSRSVSPSSDGDRRRGVAAAENSSISRRVTDGANNEPPSATTRIAVISRSSGASLSRNPLAPARSAS